MPSFAMLAMVSRGVPIRRVLHPLDEVVGEMNGELFFLVALGLLRVGLGTNRRDDALRLILVPPLGHSVRDECLEGVVLNGGLILRAELNETFPLRTIVIDV